VRSDGHFSEEWLGGFQCRAYISADASGPPMSNSEPKEPVAADASRALPTTATVVAGHDGDGAMGTRSMTVGRYEEIRRRVTDGRGVREIARALNCSRDTVR
jgi:DNA-binding NarL/FixJ family response regulator